MSQPDAPEVSASAGKRPGLAGALALYAGLAVIATWPLVTALPRVLAGDARADAWKHAWGFWWFAEGARAGTPFPVRVELLGYPGGGSLYNIDPLNSLLSIPLQLFVPLPVAFNVMLLLNLLAGATAAWALARRVSGSAACALVAGVIYAFNPFVLSYAVASGVTETTALVWMPLFLIALLRLPERGLLNAAAAGLLLGLTAFACWYYGIFALIWALLWGLWRVVSLWRESPPTERWARLRALALRVGVVAIITADVAVPPLVAFSMSLHNPDSLHPADFKRTPASASSYLDPSNSVAVRDFVTPGKGAAVISHTSDRLARSAYLGFAVIALVAIAGLTDLRARFWLVSAALFGVLSLGPALLLTRLAPAHGPNPLYAAFYAAFPGFTQIAIPYRFCVPLMLACGVLAALGLGSLTARLGSPSRKSHALVVTLAAAMVIAAEFLLVSPAPWPMPVAHLPPTEALADLPGDASHPGVLDLPVDWLSDDDKLLPGAYFYGQSHHHRPIPYRVSGHMTRAVEDHLLVALVRTLTVPGLTLRSPPTRQVLADSAATLRAMGFGALVLHREYIRADLRDKVQSTLDTVLGAPVERGDLRIYALPSGGVP